jgi:hypothetical protein
MCIQGRMTAQDVCYSFGYPSQTSYTVLDPDDPYYGVEYIDDPDTDIGNQGPVGSANVCRCTQPSDYNLAPDRRGTWLVEVQGGAVECGLGTKDWFETDEEGNERPLTRFPHFRTFTREFDGPICIWDSSNNTCIPGDRKENMAIGWK